MSGNFNMMANNGKKMNGFNSNGINSMTGAGIENMRRNMSRKNNRKNNRKNSNGMTRKNNRMGYMRKNNNVLTRKQRGGKRGSVVGSRIQVMHGTCHHTAGGLTKGDLMMHKGRIVSRKAHAAGKKAIQRLRKAGYIAKKGHFKLFTKKH